VVEYFSRIRQQQPQQTHVVPPSTPAVDRFLLNAADVTITAHVGDGGQASIYQGTWLGVQVAVKVFNFGSNSRQLAKMQKEIDREMAALTRLRHPHIVQLYGYYQEPTKTGLVMEYCGDGDLSEYCIGRPFQEKVALAAQVLSALRYLHAQGVAHGDVKPQNVLIQAGVAKLADFAMSTGAVVSVSRSISSQSGAVATGTDAYSAPEVLENGRNALSPASDMYSVGMLVYHLVEEEAPWNRENNAFIVRQATAGKLPLFKSADWNRQLEDFMTVSLFDGHRCVDLGCVLQNRGLWFAGLLHARAIGSIRRDRSSSAADRHPAQAADVRECTAKHGADDAGNGCRCHA
jgi:serine/threonine protein kinase